MSKFKYSMESFLKDSSHEYQRTYNYEFYLEKVNIIPSMIVNVTIPKISVEPFPLNWSGASIDIPSKATFEPLVLTLKENINGDVYNELWEFYNQCIVLKHNKIMVNNFESVGREAELITLDNKGRQRNKWKIHFCYMLDSPGSTFSYTENDIIHYAVVLRYLSFEYEKL